MNILVTGSSGQIGTNVALALLARGDQVTGIDIRRNTWTQAFETVTLDLSRAKGQDLPSGPFDAVMHFAAHAKVYELVENPARALENVNILFTVLDYCRVHRLPIVFASSREVYGDILRHVTDEASADFVVAESPYSASKIAGEAFIYSYWECYGLPHLVFRFSNVYGRYDSDLERMERVIPLFIRKIARNDPITVYGKEKVLDFTYVDDCVDGVLRGLDRVVAGQIQNETINLAFGQGNTLVDLVNITSLAMGVSARVTYEPARVGEVTRYVADISKAKLVLGYQPETPLSGGIPRAIEWQRSAGLLA